MTRFFALISYDGPNRNEFYSDQQLTSHLLSIGWGNENPHEFDTIEELAQMIRRHTNPNETMHNANNGAISLKLFSGLQIGDIVFVRGAAQIVDVVRVIGDAFYNPDPASAHYPGYQTFIPFEQLRPGNQIFYPVSQMPVELHDEFIFVEGRSRVFKEIETQTAIMLLLNIISNL